MNFFILILLIPLAFAQTAPDCSQLGQIVKGYESDLMKASIKSCAKLELSKLDQEIKEAAKTEDKEVTSPIDQATYSEPLFEQNRCSNFAVIENKISNLENELALLQGFEKLKANIKDQKEKTANPDEKIAQGAGRSFIDALTSAQTLDTLLNTQDQNGVNLIERLQKIPAQDRQNPEQLKAALTDICKGKQKDFCGLSLAPSQSTVDDINKLLEQSPNKKMLDDWRNAIAIKKEKDGAPYSFSQMSQELKTAFTKLDNKDTSLTREELKAIQALPDFENVKGLDFLQDLKNPKSAGNIVTANKYKFLVEDLINRQTFEMKSKISYLYGVHKDQLNDSQKASCASVSQNLSSALTCMNTLKGYSDKKNADEKGQATTSLSDLAKLLKGLEVSKSYYESLNKISQECINSDWMKDPTSSMNENCSNQLNGDISKVKTEIDTLILLKEKLGSENQRLMNFRNLALNQLAQCNEDVQKQNSKVGECDEHFSGYISQEAISLSSDVANLSVVYKPKYNDDKENQHMIAAQAECEKGQRTSDERNLCAYFTKTSDVMTAETPKVKKNPDTFQAPTEAPDGGHDPVKDAWVQGLANISRDMVDQYKRQQNRFPPMMNPYMYNYSPYGGGRPMMGISDTILFNARYYGAYGYYMPTMGYQPYTAFGTRPPAAYTPYASSKSAYFTTK